MRGNGGGRLEEERRDTRDEGGLLLLVVCCFCGCYCKREEKKKYANEMYACHRGKKAKEMNSSVEQKGRGRHGTVSSEAFAPFVVGAFVTHNTHSFGGKRALESICVYRQGFHFLSFPFVFMFVYIPPSTCSIRHYAPKASATVFPAWHILFLPSSLLASPPRPPHLSSTTSSPSPLVLFLFPSKPLTRSNY